ncbi:MAG TPA: hypothetical protein VG897_07780 [Terriglobales bacterium]|nr:hypothetical protein [Terriglobales bacterium]
MKSLRIFFAILLLVASVLAQTPTQQTPPAQPQQGTSPAPQKTQAPQQAPSVQQPQPGQQPPQELEHHITPTEAQELFKAVDEIMAFDSKVTGLPIKHPVKRKLTSRVEVQKYFVDSFKDDESAKRMTQAEVVLKKFGLIPRDSSLEGTLLALYTEAVAGYYDPKTKTVYLLDWVDPDGQKPVLAHELTHALQDQNFDLNKFMKHGKQKKTGKYDVSTSEAMSARVALMEGQAAAVMVDYLLAPQGQSVQTNPEIARAVQAGMLSDEGAPIMRKAPLYLREDLKFPYTFGLNFVLDLLKISKEKAFAEAFENPPLDTRQIMEPQTYLEHQVVAPIPMPDFDKVLGKEWKRFDVDSVGEFDISVLAREYGAAIPDAQRLAREWRHQYYFAAAKKDVKPAKPGDVSLIYVSRWSMPAAAEAFAKLDGESLKKRYHSAQPVVGGPGHWTTEEGDVFIQQQGDLVLVTEGFDVTTSGKLRNAALSAVAQDQH